ncbi:MAG TPA: GMC family oxidoreductase [Polyangiaceae bacterium]|jgi:cholesterol oxidase|nr:GMC family oxidoreductase [Polyangiaceae bacterium]
MKNTYDAVVIGTGFGGAVASCRLTQAGLSVGVFERGRRYDNPDAQGEFPFPRDFTNIESGWLYDDKQGLYDVKPIEEVFVFECAGYGGGSLIYANVHIRPVPDVFAAGWPAGYSRATLDPYYDLVAYMLDIAPITSRPNDIPPKTKLMAGSMERLGRSKQLYYPNIAVDLADAGAGPHKNKFGVTQQGCRNCGECDVGCRYRAKNTLDLNYLAVAERGGAEVSPQCKVLRIAPAADGYAVFYRDDANGGVEKSVSAKAVFVCGGAVNSTELLLRCRDEYRTLPALSAALGQGYSGNGDFLAFGFDTRAPFRPDYGPTITTGVIYDRGEGDLRSWFTLQEGGYPKQIAGLFQLLRQGDTWWPAAGNLVRDEVDREIKKAVVAKRAKTGSSSVVGTADRARDDAELAGSAVFLAMGRDRPGRIELHPVTKQLRIRWNLTDNLPLYGSEDRLVRDVVADLGGTPAPQPLWALLNQPVSVHNLGGCCMADEEGRGVTDGGGQVYGYPNLYVLDGACLPVATGVNPSHTIAAVAERNIEQFIRLWKNDPRWAPPERQWAKPIVDPVSGVTIPEGGTAPTVDQPVGLAFTETMKGFLVPADRVPADVSAYVAAEKAGQKAGARAEFTLTITAADLDRFLVDRVHAAVAVGDVKADHLTPPGGAAVTAGVFNLFVEGDGPHRRKMLYGLPFTGADGKPYLLDGYKDVVDDGHFDVWAATSTLYTVIRAGKTHDAPVCAAGVLHILIPDFLHQLTTFRVPGASNNLARVDAIARFGRMFMGALWEVFVARHFS